MRFLPVSSLLRRVVAACTFALTFAVSGFAADFTFEGVFSTDDQTQAFVFEVTGVPALVTMETFSYEGGGFDPVFSLFTADGGYLGSADSGLIPGDVFFQQDLAPGTYSLYISQYDNFPFGPDLNNGFIRTGQTNFTLEFAAPGATGFFYNGLGEQRTGTYGVEISNVASASAVTPEPVTLALLVPALCAGLTVVRRRTC